MKIRLFLYSVGVLLIQVLGNINIWLVPYGKRETIPSRLCYCEYEDNKDGFGKVSHISCCDCGASHHFWKANDGTYGIPIRPEGYSYKMRLPVDTAFADEEQKESWNTGR